MPAVEFPLRGALALFAILLFGAMAGALLLVFLRKRKEEVPEDDRATRASGFAIGLTFTGIGLLYFTLSYLNERFVVTDKEIVQIGWTGRVVDRMPLSEVRNVEWKQTRKEDVVVITGESRTMTAPGYTLRLRELASVVRERMPARN